MTSPNNYPRRYQAPPQPAANHWYHSWVVIATFLLFCSPIGLILLWISPRVSAVGKLVGTGFVGFIFLLYVVGAASKSKLPAGATTSALAAAPAAAVPVATAPSEPSVAVVWTNGNKRQACYQVAPEQVKKMLTSHTIDEIQKEVLDVSRRPSSPPPEGQQLYDG